MVEPKFRAWDSKRKEMYAFGLFDTDEGYSVDDQTSFTNMEIMQFTGLTDKNSVEIYEGDIIKLEKNIWDEIDYGLEVVTWDINYAGWSPFVWQRDENPVYSINLPFSEDYPNNIEIIGNIYENPEILNEKN